MLKKYDYNLILYFLYSLILFVIPWKLFLDDNFAYIFSIIARLFSIVLFFIYQKKYFLFENKTKKNKYFYFIPFFICCFQICFYFFLQKIALKLKI